MHCNLKTTKRKRSSEPTKFKNQSMHASWKLRNLQGCVWQRLSKDHEDHIEISDAESSSGQGMGEARRKVAGKANDQSEEPKRGYSGSTNGGQRTSVISRMRSWNQSIKNTKAESVLGCDIVKDDAGSYAALYSPNRVRLRLK